MLFWRRHFLPSRTQQPGKLWRGGVLRPGPDDLVFRQNFVPFVQALRELRFVDGVNLTLEYRVRAANAQTMLALADELVRAKVNAILAVAPAGVSAAAKSTRSIPIVAVDLESDPIAQGFAASLAAPKGNITRLFLDFPGPNLLRGTEVAGSSLGVRLVRLEAPGASHFERAFESAVMQRAEAVMALSSPVFNSGRKQIAELALRHRLPTLMPFPGFADDGGLLAHGPHLTALFQKAGIMMAKVLQEASPGQIPIERPARFEFVVNLKTARALGITIPSPTLLRADRLID